jgi:hypothetical protein
MKPEQAKLLELSMATYDGLIAATSNAWSAASRALEAIPTDPNADPAAFSRALLNAQVSVNNAAALEQRTSTVIQTAFQAHTQVASR